MDAGPNVKLICKASQMEELMEKFTNFHKTISDTNPDQGYKF